MSWLDVVVMHREQALLSRRDASVCVDLGLGDEPWTTLELARALGGLRADLQLIGVDCDARRVARARASAAQGVEFRLGGFALPLRSDEPALLVRAMNVLRDYRDSDVRAAHESLAAALVPGGLLLEGTCSPDGGVACVHWLRKQSQGLAREGLLFASDFSRGFAPLQFRDQLPRDLKQNLRRCQALFEFLQAWNDAFQSVRSAGIREASGLFSHSAQLLATRASGIVLDSFLLDRGCILWQPQNGIPPASPALAS